MLDEIAAWRNYLLTRHYSTVVPSIPPRRVSMVAMKIRYLIEQLVSVEVKVPFHSRYSLVAQLDNSTTLSCCKTAGLKSYMGGWRRGQSLCCLCAFNLSKASFFQLFLSDARYFKRKASTDLTEADLHHLRKLASEHMAKLIVDSVSDHEYLFTDLLLRR